MRIDASYGSDTGMYLVDVYLETERECAFEVDEIWQDLHTILAAKRIRVDAVVDFYLHKQDGSGKWVCTGILA